MTIELQHIGTLIFRYLLRKVRYWANFDWREAVFSLSSAYRFLTLETSEKMVLMIEPNKFHAEVLPGYCHYFSKLGFKVVLLTRRANASSGVFDLVATDEKPLTFSLHPSVIKYLMHSRQPDRFAFVFVTSAYWSEAFGYFGLFTKYLRQNPQGRYGYAMVAHDFEHIRPDIDSSEVSLNQISQLSANEYQGNKIDVINPHYFGSVTEKPPKAHRIFITVGSQYRKFENLIDAVAQLERIGYRDFRVHVVGGGALRDKYPHASERIEFLGRLPFPELYQRLAAADYYLDLLDPDNQEHRRYLTGTTTGSRQLILGFHKIPVMQEKFAQAYGFSEQNAIVFGELGLVDGMQQALEAPIPMLLQLKSALAELQNTIEVESLINLRKQIFGSSEKNTKNDLCGR